MLSIGSFRFNDRNCQISFGTQKSVQTLRNESFRSLRSSSHQIIVHARERKVSQEMED